VRNNKGSTPLHFFAYSAAKSNSIAQLLLDGGVDIDCTDVSGRTPYLIAATGGNVDMLQFFAQEGANTNARDASGDGALDLAKFHRNAEAVRFLERSSAGRTGK